MPIPFFPRLLEDWLPPERLFQTSALPDSPRLCAALNCTGSLTRYLQEQTGQTVRIRLESQEPMLEEGEEDALLWDTCHTLPPDSKILARNAWLVLADQEWLFAHSQVAMAALPIEAREAIEQGEEPLGSLFLEREGSVERSGLELARAYIPDLAHHLGQQTDSIYWCRRSLFCVNHGIHARIFEIFLPALLLP